MYWYRKPRLLHRSVWCICIAVMFAACSTIKNYPPNKPFVFSNEVVINGKISKDEKKRLKNELSNYWDDSLKARKVQQFGFIYKMKNPPVFDTINVSRTMKYMHAYLNSQGYYYAHIDPDTSTIKKKKDQIRTNVKMTINIGKNITIDSVSYALADSMHTYPGDSALQQLAMQQFSKSLLQKGKPYTKQVISDELDRLVNWFRQHGYYKYTREFIYALVDTSEAGLFKLTLDPFEQAKLVAEAARKKMEDPKWDIQIKQHVTADSSRLIRFYIGTVYFYPETRPTDNSDSLMTRAWPRQTVSKSGNYVIRDYHGKFKLRPMREHTYLQKDSLYNEEYFYKSVNTLSQIPAWQQVDAKIVVRGLDTLDIHFFMDSTAKYQTNYSLEGSLNRGDFTSGSLIGFLISTSLINRNVARLAIQSKTNISAGVELNIYNSTTAQQQLVQTLQLSFGHWYSFPRLIMPNFMKSFANSKKIDNKRTIIGADAAYTDRFNTYRLYSLVSSFGWEWQQGKNLLSVKPINLELYNIDTLPLLDSIFTTNPFLRNSFNDGNVLGVSGSFIRTFNQKNNPNKSHFIRFSTELSGLYTIMFKNLNKTIYNYAKFEADYRFTHKRPKSEVGYRFFAGIAVPKGGEAIPFFKQFYAGGPYSMRAWPLRQLGLGSSILNDTIPATSFRDRYGDIQLETNLEYRFTLATFGSIKLGSALFADVGNVWGLKKNPADPGSEFSFSRLGKDIAIAMGTGVRLDFSYFLLRVDFGYKVKDPARQENGGWMSFKDFRWTETRNNVGQTRVRNYAFQLGVGLPF